MYIIQLFFHGLCSKWARFVVCRHWPLTIGRRKAFHNVYQFTVQRACDHLLSTIRLVAKLLHQMQSGGTHRRASGSNSRSSTMHQSVELQIWISHPCTLSSSRSGCAGAPWCSCGNVFHHVSDVILAGGSSGLLIGDILWLPALVFFHARACCSNVCKFADGKVCQFENPGRLPVNTAGGGELTGPKLCFFTLWFGPIARCSICRGRWCFVQAKLPPLHPCCLPISATPLENSVGWAASSTCGLFQAGSLKHLLASYNFHKSPSNEHNNLSIQIALVWAVEVSDEEIHLHPSSIIIPAAIPN